QHCHAKSQARLSDARGMKPIHTNLRWTAGDNQNSCRLGGSGELLGCTAIRTGIDRVRPQSCEHLTTHPMQRCHQTVRRVSTYCKLSDGWRLDGTNSKRQSRANVPHTRKLTLQNLRVTPHPFGTSREIVLLGG